MFLKFLQDLTLLKLLQRAADWITICVSFALGYLFYTEFLDNMIGYGFLSYCAFGAFAATIFLVILHGAKLYEREISLLNLVETRGILWVWLLSSMIVFTSSFYVRILDLSRIMVTVSLLLSLFLLIFERAIFYRIHLRMNLRGYARKRVLIYGAGRLGKHLIKRIFHSPALDIMPIGFLDDNEDLWGKKVHITEIHVRNPSNAVEVFGDVSKLEEIVKEKNIHEVYLAMPTANYDRLNEVICRCRELKIPVAFVPPTFDNQIYHMQVEELGGIPVLREKRYVPSHPYLFIKRIFDIAFSGFALFLLSPVFVIVSLMIRSDSPGPIFFRQKRVGLNGREFSLLKFRTMYAESPKYAVNPLSSQDPRITKIGRWLRRSSLDEVPQFINVLLGDMSVVGPRPEMPFIVDEYDDVHRERLLVKPGITGIWQISAVRGEPIHANIEYDLFYLENQSLLLDAIIILRTFLVAIRGFGAF